MTVTLANYWHPIATADEVTMAPRAFTLLGERLVVFRDAEGVVTFKDLCIHRGTALSRGSITDGRITCPYHGWQYDRTGACVHIPALPAGTPIPRKARATTYQTQETSGLVWVALEEPVQPLPPWPDDAWNNPAYHVFVAKTYEWKASAGRVTENALEFSHFNFVHKGFTELADGPLIKPYDVEETQYGVEYAYEDGKLRREYTIHVPFTVHDRKQIIADNARTWSEQKGARKGDVTLLSFLSSPVDATATRIFVLIARNHSLDVDDAKFSLGFDEVMAQDQFVVESQRPELIPTDLAEELHVKVPDACCVAYRRQLGKIAMVGPFLP
jgi:phenylpropionate dioxygenase-like ring-hydroxylating dioxygenase large terminal subunit